MFLDPKYQNNEHQLLRSILKGAPHSILTLKSIRDESRKIVDFAVILINRKSELIFGKNTEKLIGKRFLDLLEGNEWKELFETFKENFSHKDFLTIEKQFSINKKPKWFQITGIHYDDALTLHFSDVTEHKNLVQYLSLSERKYRTLFNESLDPVILMDMKLKLVNSNKAFRKLLGFDSNKKNRLYLKDLMVNETDYKNFKSSISERRSIKEFETILIDSDNNEHLCMIHCAPLKERIEDRDIFITVIRDISERKRIEKDLLFAEKMSYTGRLARVIAHEVRNPLTNINLAINELDDEIPEKTEDVDFYLDMIKRNTSRIQSLIKDLMESSKHKKLELTRGSINRVLENTIKLVKDRVNLREMNLKTDFEKDLPDIQLDNQQLQVAFLNLILNAIEAMEPVKGELNIRTRNADHSVSVIIEDNGHGIEEDDLQKIFDPFFTSKRDGTGVGLTATKNIINSHSGKIFVESVINDGTVFTINFPVPNGNN